MTTTFCVRTIAIVTGAVFGITACQTNDAGKLEPPGIRVLSGAGLTDTIDGLGASRLVLSVIKPNGAPAEGVIVRFESQAPVGAIESGRFFERGVFVCGETVARCEYRVGNVAGLAAFDTTDAQGLAVASVRIGTVAGRAFVRVSVPEFGFVDSATYTVNAGAPVSLRAAVADTLLNIGDTASVRGIARDRYSNIRSASLTFSASVGAALSVNPATGVITSTAMGAQFALARSGSLVDSVRVVVLPQGRLVSWSNSRTLQLHDIDGTNVRPLLASAISDWDAAPQFDLTRQRVTFHISGATRFNDAPNVVVVLDTTGVLRRDILDTDSKFLQVYAQRLLADGSILVFALRNTNPSIGVWRVAVDGTTSLVAAVGAGGMASGDISPDGSKFAYLTATASDGSRQLRVLTLATGVDVIATRDARAPRWSRQSDRLVYFIPKNVGAATGFPAVVQADGSNPRQLGTYEVNHGLSWSPDAQYIIGSSSPSFNVYQLRLMRVSDGLSLLLPVAPYREPDWR